MEPALQEHWTGICEVMDRIEFFSPKQSNPNSPLLLFLRCQDVMQRMFFLFQGRYQEQRASLLGARTLLGLLALLLVTRSY